MTGAPGALLRSAQPETELAPFQLLAIVNRTDLHATSNGELRFVYGLVDPEGFGQLMSVIFEFELPNRDARSGADLNRLSWVERFQALGDLDFGADYNTSLQGLTDGVTRRGSNPSRPGGSAISQVRSNEIMMGNEWQLREFHLTGEGPSVSLSLAPTAMTPDDVHGIPDTPENDAIADYINDNAVAIRGGFAAVPSARIGGPSTVGFSWSFFKPVDERARRSFGGQTCNGCHSVEAASLQLDGFYHISPIAEGGPDGFWSRVGPHQTARAAAAHGLHAEPAELLGSRLRPRIGAGLLLKLSDVPTELRSPISRLGSRPSGLNRFGSPQA